MTANSLYETPVVLQEYVLAQRNQQGTPRSDAEIRARTDTLDRLREKWAAIVDTSTFGQLNDLMGIRLAGNGRLVVTYQADHTFTDGTLIAVPYRFVNEAQIRRFVGDYLGWLTVDVLTDNRGVVTKVILKPAQNTSRLRVRAFAQAVEDAKGQLGQLISQSSTSSQSDPMLVIDGGEIYIDGTYQSGVQLHQLYWVLAVAKEVRDNLMQLMRTALKANRADVVAPEKKRDTSAAFDTYLDRRKEFLRRTPEKKTIQNLPLINDDIVTPRTWGIEVEAAGARGVDAPGDDWDRKGDGSLESAYSGNRRVVEDCPEHDHDNETVWDEATQRYVENEEYVDPDDCDWVYGGDQDYDEEDYYGGDTAEFVSPILNKPYNNELKQLVADLSNEPQNDSAGVHVHVDAADLTPRNIGALVFAYSVIEPIIEPAYQRKRRNYCKERGSGDVLQVVRSTKVPNAKKSYRDSSADGPVIHAGDRYHSVNLQALEAHGTVEFRAMGPVYNYEHLIKWALFCREMVAISKLNLPPKTWTSIKNWRDLERVLYKYGTELKAYTIRQHEQEFAASESKKEFVLA